MISIDEKKLFDLCMSLKYIYGIVALIIGLDKFTFLIVDWNIYVSPLIELYLPLPIALHVVHIVGVIEIIAGIIILSKHTRFGAFLTAAWIGVVILNLLTFGGMYDIILRDIAIAIGYITLGILTKIKDNAQQYQ